LLCDNYKLARAEADAKEARVQQRMNEVVEVLEGLTEQEQGPNQRMKHMIEDLHLPAHRQGFGRHTGQRPTSNFSILLHGARTPV
jgi:hypothetical protein